MAAMAAMAATKAEKEAERAEKAAQKAAAHAAPLAVGERVFHEEHGAGTLEALPEGGGATVEFDDKDAAPGGGGAKNEGDEAATDVDSALVNNLCARFSHATRDDAAVDGPL